MIKTKNHEEKAGNNWMSGQQLLDMNITEVPKLWDPFFPREGLVLLCGGSDTGKTTLLKQMVFAVASGEEFFLGYKLNSIHGSAIGVLSEDGPEAVAAGLTKQLKDLDDTSIAENMMFLFETEDIIGDLDRALSKKPADFVFIDTLSDFIEGNPNNLIDVRKGMKLYDTLAKKHHCAICFIHHNVKNSEKQAPDKAKLNGSQAFEAKVRNVLELRHGTAEGTRLLTVLKGNYMPQQMKRQSITLSFEEETLSFSNTGKFTELTGGQSAVKKYDASTWMPRFNSLVEEGMSQREAKRVLDDTFCDDDVPGLSWFKTHLNQLKGEMEERGMDFRIDFKN